MIDRLWNTNLGLRVPTEVGNSKVCIPEHHHRRPYQATTAQFVSFLLCWSPLLCFFNFLVGALTTRPLWKIKGWQPTLILVLGIHTTSLGFRGMESGTGMIATGRQQSGKQLSGAFLLGLCCDLWSLSSIQVFLGAGFDTLWITRGEEHDRLFFSH